MRRFNFLQTVPHTDAVHLTRYCISAQDVIAVLTTLIENDSGEGSGAKGKRREPLVLSTSEDKVEKQETAPDLTLH